MVVKKNVKRNNIRKTTSLAKKSRSTSEIMHTIFDYISRISKERDENKLIILFADMGRDLINSDRCTIWLLDKKNDTLWSVVAHGVDKIVIPRSKGIAGCVANTGKPEIINDPYNDPRFDKDIDKHTGYKTRNIICLPIRDSEGGILGCYQAINKMSEPGIFTETDLDHLLLAASYSGKQLEAFMLQQEIELTQKEIIFTLAETGEMRSKETGYHVKRVAEYSRILAQKIGMHEDMATLLKNSSPLHDIGKIAIPDAILLKEGKLTDAEAEVMKTHASLGYEMLKHSDREILKAAATIAFEHHEKWDGTGYPRKIAGEKIHIFGRITAIADVFDALGSDRVYKKAWPIEKIIDLFKKEKGVHFDPGMTEKFLDNIDEFIEIKNRYRDLASPKLT